LFSINEPIVNLNDEDYKIPVIVATGNAAYRSPSAQAVKNQQLDSNAIKPSGLGTQMLESFVEGLSLGEIAVKLKQQF